MMSVPLQWPDKFPAEQHRNGADWSRVLGDAAIVSCAAQVMEGDVVITVPAATDFSGAVQGVWLTGGTAGRQIVRMKVVLSDGQKLEQDFRFWVLP
jgi:hypothetical protein